jgi:hypothetical protein
MEQGATISIVVGLGLLIGLGIYLYTQRHRISGVGVTASLEGVKVSVELRELIRLEVNRATAEMLRRAATLDKQLIEFWERESLFGQEDAVPKFKMLQDNVAQIESQFESAPEAEKAQVGLVLREAYLVYLKEARSVYTSSPQYQQIRARVLAGLTKLQQLK